MLRALNNGGVLSSCVDTLKSFLCIKMRFLLFSYKVLLSRARYMAVEGEIASATSSLVDGGSKEMFNVVGVCAVRLAGEHRFCSMKRDFFTKCHFCTKIVCFVHVLRQYKA